MAMSKKALYSFDDVDGKKVLRLNFHAGQLRAWNSKARIVAILAGSQSGKALPLDTSIATPTGFTTMDDLCVGDTIYADNGKACRVTMVTPVQLDRTCYQITFDDDSCIVADSDHLWQVQSAKQRKNQDRRVKNPNPSYAARPQCTPTNDYSILTTSQILGDYSLHQKTKAGLKRRSNYSIDLCQPIDYPKRELPIEPYTLGAWLGNGYSHASNVVIFDDEVRENIAKDGYKIAEAPYDCNTGKAKCYIIGNTGNGKHRNYFTGLLKTANVKGNKHIPEIYKIASIEQRFALLQGLFDTDGYAASDGEVEFCSINETLANDVLELLRSVGIKARLRTGKAVCNGKDCGVKYRIFATTDKPLFRVQRKLDNQNCVRKRKDVYRRFIVSIVPVPSVPVRCIQVDSENSLYVASRNYIVTHNTSSIPWFLHREIEYQKTVDSGLPHDYLAVTANYDLFKLKFLPELKTVFEDVTQIGRYWSSTKVIELKDPVTGKFRAKKADDSMWGRIILRSADAGSGLESSTARAALLDEAGMDTFTKETYEAILRRLSLSQGRIFLGTTIYNLGWVKTEIYDRAQNGDKSIDVIQFDSTENPMFPKDEFDRARESMPLWRFDMFYRGIFSRPAGQIYDNFSRESNLLPRFSIPSHWQRYIGLDFGSVNLVAVYLARDPHTQKLYLYKLYKEPKKTVKEHADAILSNEPGIPLCAGGTKSEDNWRNEFAAAGLPVQKPKVWSVDVGIDKVYGLIPNLYIFDDLEPIVNEFESYSRKVNTTGETINEIDQKSLYHFLDALRYAATIVSVNVNDNVVVGNARQEYSVSSITTLPLLKRALPVIPGFQRI